MLFHGLQHHVLHVVTQIASGASYLVHDFLVTPVQRKREAQLIAIVTARFKTIGAPAGIAARHGDTSFAQPSPGCFIRQLNSKPSVLHGPLNTYGADCSFCTRPP